MALLRKRRHLGLQVDSRDQQLEELAVHVPLKPGQPTWTSPPMFVVCVCAHRGQTIAFRSWFFPSAICIWDIKLRSADSVTGAFPISLAGTPLFETVSISPGQHQTLPVVKKNLKYPACTS